MTADDDDTTQEHRFQIKVWTQAELHAVVNTMADDCGLEPCCMAVVLLRGVTTMLNDAIDRMVSAGLVEDIRTAGTKH